MSENHNGIQLFPDNVDIKANIDAAEVVRATVDLIKNLWTWSVVFVVR